MISCPYMNVFELVFVISSVTILHMEQKPQGSKLVCLIREDIR